MTRESPAASQAAARCLGARSLTLVITTRPLTFSVTFQEIVTLLPLEIACRAIRNSATIAMIATNGQSMDGRLAQHPSCCADAADSHCFQRDRWPARAIRHVTARSKGVG
jgi:hypothetical protein